VFDTSTWIPKWLGRGMRLHYLRMVLTPLDVRGAGGDLANRLPRPQVAGDAPVAAVRDILHQVEESGDAALRLLTERFDGVVVDDLEVAPAELAAAYARIPEELRAALVVAEDAIASFHRSQMRPAHRHERDGIRVDGREIPVDRAGLYVPGGRAIYPSTVLMTAVPARVAGVGEVVLCVPPDRSGAVPDATLAAAHLAGVDRVFRIGGAQAIGAMAYGTETVPSVDVIAGPGNVYVAIAKREVAGSGLVGVPSAFAGPSEVVVVADASASPDHVAIDVLLQAEHGPDGLAWLIAWDESVISAVSSEVARLVDDAPRKEDMLSTLAEGGYAVLCEGPEQAIEVANLIAPEHLELMTADPELLVPLVRHAGAVFCGPYSPASIGDYVAGPSHVLPTDGSARFSSALTVGDFLKQLHVITVDRSGLDRLGPHVVTLAEAEGLDAHARSIRLRQGLGS